jgi:hypothetical protein
VLRTPPFWRHLKVAADTGTVWANLGGSQGEEATELADAFGGN